eukprot:550499_1
MPLSSHVHVPHSLSLKSQTKVTRKPMESSEDCHTYMKQLQEQKRLPKLCKRNTVRHDIVVKITSANYVPYHYITEQFARYSYIRYSKKVVCGYINNLGKQSNSFLNIKYAPSLVTDLCLKYYIIKEDGLYQLGFQIQSIMKQINKTAITVKILKMIIAKYLKLNKHPAKVSYYFNELIRSQYIVPVNENKKLYSISIQKSIVLTRTLQT